MNGVPEEMGERRTEKNMCEEIMVEKSSDLGETFEAHKLSCSVNSTEKKQKAYHPEGTS